MDFFTNPIFTPFAVSAYILGILLTLELLMAFSGLGSTSFLDDLLPEFPEPPAGVLSASGALYYFGVGKVPALIYITIFCGFFSVSGLVFQSTALNVVGFALPVWLAVMISIPTSLFFTRPLSNSLGRVINSEKGHAPSRQSLIGRKATITDGIASSTSSAAAIVRDAEGTSLDIYVKSATNKDIFAKGDGVLIVSVTEGFYLVTKSD